MPNCTLRQRAASFFELRRALTAPGATVIVNKVAFPAAADPATFTYSEDGRRMLLQPNAGGTSVWSEVLSFEIMRAAYGAVLQRTEMEIEYDWMGSKKTDYSCSIDGVGVVAVSVTRALKHRGAFSRQDAYELLYKKLRCVQGSNQNVCVRHRWERQILHVWTVSFCWCSFIISHQSFLG